MTNSRDKFLTLLREIFQFDVADLDFGIYRIMNHKRRVIERWITQDLPKAIEEELHRGALAEQQQARQVLEQARQKALETLGEDAIDAEGNLAEQYHNTKVGREYLEARQKAAHARPSDALEAQVYNHLYTFFSRYYQDGDFVSKRRYSKKERYAIPYNGEEVYLYWANHDQYYVKTAEHFTDYTWKAANGVTVHFKLQAADVEVNNVKGDKRFFIPVLDGIAWDADARALTVPFNYRPLTKEEESTYGNKNQQDRILGEALSAIPRQLKDNTEALAALNAERRRDAKGKPVSYLEHHLRQYTARNTRDFFIHKDLKGFLSRELDFYLKNEVLNLDELEAAGEELAPGWFQLMRLIKRVGNHIIDFLAQIEDFQKALWEKKKFVTETFWCITVGNIPEHFYPEIAANQAQWQEWKALFAIDELPKDLFSGDLEITEGRIAFLKAHPTLVLDTRHFSLDFTDRLLASFENLDEATDGVLVHSENWQALNLMLEKYRERAKTIYIDPPYNTGTDEFLYRDNFQHASWLSMMYDRLKLGREWMREDGAIFVSIDYNEVYTLAHALSEIFVHFKNSIVIRRGVKNVQAQFSTVDALNRGHEYVLLFTKNDKTHFPKVLVGQGRQHGSWNNHWRGTDRPSMRYELFGIIPEKGQWRWSKERSLRAIENYKRLMQELGRGDTKIAQVDIDQWWYREYKRTGQKLDLLRLSSSGTPEHYVPPSEGSLLSDLWNDLQASSSSELQNVVGGDSSFPVAKNSKLIERILLLANEHRVIILDYFAGSGTTGHAVINLNRENGGRRKFILVEMAKYFDTVLLPRIKKVTFTPEWKDGKPKRMATQEEFERGPRVVKVIRLESYEDALNNITFDENEGQQALALFGDDYLLRYMLQWETRKSETFLDVEKLQTPFSYKLHIHRDGETRVQPVDLPETFNYLIGLDVERRQVVHDGDRRYLVYRGATRNGRKVAVIWRETKGWTQEDYERDAQFVAKNGLAEGADEVFVNGDSYIESARSLDGLFKARLFGREG